METKNEVKGKILETKKEEIGDLNMKVAYIFNSSRAHEILNNMVVPQMEKGIHGADIVGMFFFGDNTYILQNGNTIGERLSNLSEKNGMLLMACDRCVIDRAIQNNLIEGVRIGCFPDLYGALASVPLDQVITL